MGSFWPQKLCTNRKRAMEELVKGRDMATQLQILFKNPSGDHGSVLAEEFVVKILRSFTESISVLMISCESCEACQIPATTQVGSPSSGDRRSVDSGESRKRPAVKDQRGCYKRRMSTSDSWMKVSPTTEDGYAWRKYGQKEIMNAQFPRCYFRCTHKHDHEGCLATKQVQMIQENPHMYQTTYFGHHTCREDRVSQNYILGSDPVESHLIRFGSKISSDDEQDDNNNSSSIKEERNENTQSNLSNDISAMDSIFWRDLLHLESLPASTDTSRDLDLDFMIQSVGFENVFPDFF